MSPQRRALHGLGFTAAFLGALLLLCLNVKAPANIYDEGLVLLNAERIRLGEIPHRDFWTVYATGYHHLLAGVFSMVEPSILKARIFDTFLRFLITLCVYLCARALTSPGVALLPFGLVALWLANAGSYGYPAYPAVGAILIAGPAFQRHLAGSGDRWLLVTGMALGATAVLRLDFGGYAALGFGFAAALRDALRSDPRDSGTGPLLRIARSQSLLAAGALGVSVPFYGHLILASGWESVYRELIVFPATVFPAMRHLPLPAVLPDPVGWSGEKWRAWANLYLPLLVFAAAGVFAVRSLWRTGGAANPHTAIAGSLLALSMTGMGLFLKACSRFTFDHALPAAICAAVLGTALAARIPRRPWRVACLVIVPALLALRSCLLLVSLQLEGPLGASPLGCYSSTPRAGCVPIGTDQEQMAELLRTHTRRGEYVFIGNSRHDLTPVNDALLHFLADRPSPTRFAELHPGLATTLPVQQAIVTDLRTRGVGWVVTLDLGERPMEPNASAVSSQVTYLDDHIRENYVPVTTIGSYRLWRLRPRGSPR